MAEPVRSQPGLPEVPAPWRAAVPPARPGGREEWRRTLLRSPCVGLVEDLRREGDHPSPDRDEPCPDFQVCLPYRGLFVWQVSGGEVVGDANQVVFVAAGDGSRVQSPAGRGYGELILTPGRDLLARLAGRREAHLRRHPLFRRRARGAGAGLQVLRARLLHRTAGGAAAAATDALEVEELVLDVLREALHPDGGPLRPREPAAARLVRRTKEFLEAELANRILLSDIGRAVGACPAHLAELFRRAEGTSLHQYLIGLRLARALAELPHTEDLTGLALDLGFSSHSHFTAAFRRAFGTTPSSFRRSTRQPGTRLRARRSVPGDGHRLAPISRIGRGF